MSCASITNLATAIWNDLGQPTDTPVSYIQNKLMTDAFLGKLNTLTANCYIVSGAAFSPDMGTDEQGIYALMYEQDFYVRKFNLLANGTDIDWVVLKDGDSSISRSNIVDKMRVYRDMQKQLNQQLNMAVAAYRQDQSVGQSVDFYGIDNGWQNGNYYPGGFIGGPG